MDADLQYRRWVKLLDAVDPFEVMMIQAYLEAHGIESRQPFGQHSYRYTGLGIGGGSGEGMRIDVPEDQFDAANRVLAERRRARDSGETLPLQEEQASIEQGQIADFVASHELAHEGDVPESRISDDTMRMVYALLGIAVVIEGLVLYLNGYAQSVENIHVTDMSRGVFVSVVGVIVILVGAFGFRASKEVLDASGTQPEHLPPTGKEARLPWLARLGLLIWLIMWIPLPVGLLLDKSIAKDPITIAVIGTVIIFLMAVWMPMAPILLGRSCSGPNTRRMVLRTIVSQFIGVEGMVPITYLLTAWRESWFLVVVGLLLAPFLIWLGYITVTAQWRDCAESRPKAVN